ncbi:MAG: DNA primase [Ginsengibacter sp.]
MISPSTIQQILSRIDIIEIISSFIKLKKRGSNYLGLCPFHNEKTPSFTVSPAKEIYKCFGCGRSGNSISFLMEHEKFSYVEALRWLAVKYNVEIEETELSPEVKQQQQVSDSLYIINNFAQKFFTDVLFNNEEGRDIGLSYLKQRGYREDIIKRFQLGFNPEAKDSFSQAALAAQYQIDLLQKSGLVTVRDDKPADNYRGRIIFPIHTQSGKIAGFGARLIKNNDKAPKYINTPENEIFIKSKILYGAYFARMAIDKANECLLVEGYTDVVSLHQAGIENAVASGGTSLTPDQLRLVKKYTNNLTIIYDGDTAGIKAALRGLDLALEEGLNVKLVLIPDNEDPDSYLNNKGPTAFIDFIKTNKKDFILFQLDIALADAADDSYKKSIVVNQIAETISKINKAEDFTRQQDYIRKSSQLLKIDESGLHSLVNKFIREKINKEVKREPVINIKGFDEVDNIDETARTDWSDETFSLIFQHELQEKAVIKVILDYGLKDFHEAKNVIEYIVEEDFDEELFQNKNVPLLINIYNEMYRQGMNPTARDLAYYPNNEISKLVIESTNYPYELSKKWNEKERTNKINKRIFNLNYEEFMSQIIHNENADEIIYLHDVNETYKDEVEDVLIYLKLQKLKRMILVNENDLETDTNSEKIREYMDTHLHLKNMQMELSKKKKIVIYPF